MKFTLGVWEKNRKRFKLPLNISRTAIIRGMMDFKPGKEEGWLDGRKRD